LTVMVTGDKFGDYDYDNETKMSESF